MRWLLPAEPLGKFTWRMLATVLASQAVVIFFGALVARGLAGTEDQGDARASRLLWVGTGLAVLAVVAAGIMRRRGGVLLGWVVQLGTLAAGFVVGDMFVVGLIFLALWLWCLRTGARVDGAPTGAAPAPPAG